MKNFRMALRIFLTILFLTVISTTYTKKTIDYIETQVRVIEPINDFSDGYMSSYYRLKDNFMQKKKYLKKVINKDYVYDIESKINLLESSLKLKDITSIQENCIEIMSILDNIESCYMEIS